MLMTCGEGKSGGAVRAKVIPTTWHSVTVHGERRYKYGVTICQVAVATVGPESGVPYPSF